VLREKRSELNSFVDRRGNSGRITGVKVYPLKLKPIYKRRIWGGQKLRELLGKNIPPGEKIGESWELADLPDEKSTIANGELAGKTLGAAIEEYPAEITGDKDFSGPFPLLIKFLDAEDVLSVQVHPDAQTCERLGKGEPKTECWYIISAAEDAFIYKGLKEGVTRKEFSTAIKEGTVAELLVKMPVTEGECHLLPAGTAHSIGAGLLIAEIQTPSDTTYRVFDWNRVDDNGKARELHIEEALESIHFGVCGADLPVTQMSRLADTDYFQVDKSTRVADCEQPVGVGLMRTLIIVAGCGEIGGSQGDPVKFKAGDTVLIPAGYEGTIRFAAETLYLTVTT
jgi:mannose-6-phosphate isomerase